MLPVLVAKLKAATARVVSLRASLAAQDTLGDGHDALPDVTADRKVLRALGVQITVDQALKEAIIMGDVARVVAGRLSPNGALSKEVGIP